MSEPRGRFAVQKLCPEPRSDSRKRSRDPLEETPRRSRKKTADGLGWRPSHLHWPFITVCTYSAASGAGGGIYLIAFGPVIAGIVRIIRALEVPKSNATGSAPPRGYQFKPHEKVRILSNRFREKGAPFGSIGYVIEKWADNLWEVEVSRVDGTAIARFVVRPEDIELAGG